MKLVSYCLLALLLIATGCNNAGSESETGAEQVSQGGLPKLNLHKPDSLAAAAERLETLIAALSSDGPVPEGKQLRVLEVIHGTGSSAHSHYYLANDEGEAITDHGHDDHEDMEEEQKIHDVVIDPFTELVDIARWLPDIAGDGDLPREAWTKVNKAAGEMQKILDQMPSGDTSAKKSFVQKKSSELKELLSGVQKLATEG